MRRYRTKQRNEYLFRKDTTYIYHNKISILEIILKRMKHLKGNIIPSYYNAKLENMTCQTKILKFNT